MAVCSSKRKDGNVIAALKKDDCIITNDVEKAKCLNELFESVFNNQVNNDLSSTNFKRVNLVYTEDDIFYEHEVNDELLSLDDSKTCGPDGIKPKFFKMAAVQLCYPLCRLFNLSFNCGKLPNDWRIAHIAPVHKKGTKSDPANYRPVSLTSIICKLMEKLIRKTLINHLDKIIS